MFRKICHDVKIAALNLYEGEVLPLPDILACMGFSKRTFYHVLKLWRETGDIVSHQRAAHTGHPHLLHYDNIQYFLRLIQHQPDWFLAELLNLLKTNYFVSVHYTLLRT